MEGLGCDFDDSVFGAFRERRPAPGMKLGSYRAKICQPGWFWGEICTVDDVEKLTVLKFRGDLAFRSQDYQKALCEYSSSLALVPESNIALRRDLQEAQARCLCFLGRPEDALDIAQKLRAEVTNMDHLTTVLNLDMLIYRNAGNLSQELCCLQQLVSLHPLNPWYWKKLAESYLSLAQTVLSMTMPVVPVCKDGHCLRMPEKTAVKSETPPTKADCTRPQKPSKDLSERWTFVSRNASEEENSDPIPTSNLKELSGSSNVVSFYSAVGNNIKIDPKSRQRLKNLWLFACSSFVRARLLLQMVKAQQASFVLERNLIVQEEIKQQLSNLELREEALNAISKTMGEDLFPDRFKNGTETERPGTLLSSSSLTHIAIESGSDFEERWFKKLGCETFYGSILEVGQDRKEKASLENVSPVSSLP